MNPRRYGSLGPLAIMAAILSGGMARPQGPKPYRVERASEPACYSADRLAAAQNKRARRAAKKNGNTLTNLV